MGKAPVTPQRIERASSQKKKSKRIRSGASTRCLAYFRAAKKGLRVFVQYSPLFFFAARVSYIWVGARPLQTVYGEGEVVFFVWSYVLIVRLTATLAEILSTALLESLIMGILYSFTHLITFRVYNFIVLSFLWMKIKLWYVK